MKKGNVGVGFIILNYDCPLFSFRFIGMFLKYIWADWTKMKWKVNGYKRTIEKTLSDKFL